MKITSIIALLLCTCILCMSCGCGAISIDTSEAASSSLPTQSTLQTPTNKDNTQDTNQGAVSFDVEDITEATTEYSYVYGEYELDNSYRINDMAPGRDSQIYLLATACDNDGYSLLRDDTAFDQRILGYKVSEDKATEVFSYAPNYDDYDDFYFVSSIASAEDGTVWGLLALMKFVEDDLAVDMRFVHLDAEGTELSVVDAQIGSEYSDGHIQVDRLGNLYYLSNGHLFIFDESGRLQSEEDVGSYDPPSRTASGNVCLLVDTENGSGISVIDAATLQTGDPVTLSGTSGYPMLCDGAVSEDSILISTETVLYEVDFQTGQADPLVELGLYGISIGSGCFGMLEDQTIVFLMDTNKAFDISALKQTSTGTNVTKKVLSFATIYPESPILDLINEFNRSNENYFVKVFDFSDYMDSGSYSELFKAWNEAFVSGDCPDMIDFFNLPWQVYAQKGLLLDLNNYLDTEDISPWLWSALSYKGSNYTFPSCFAIETVYGKAEALNGQTSWNINDFYSVAESLPDGIEMFHQMNQGLFLFYIEQYMIDDFIDYEDASCQFDTDQFIQLLDYASSLPEAIDNQDEIYMEESISLLVRRNQVLLEPIVLTGIEQMHKLEDYTIGEKISWIGWPCEHASKVQTMSDISIMSTSKNIDGAVEFLSYLMNLQSQRELSDDYFPITISSMNEMLEEAKIDRSLENPDIATETTVDGVTYQLSPVTDSEVERYTSWMESISGQLYYQWDVAAIIDEECGALFAGDKDAAETAKIIQNRVQLYLSEQ